MSEDESRAGALPAIGILMINYNQWELTRKCVESLRRSEGVRVIMGLVDNNSSGEPPAWVHQGSDILFHRSGTNSGFIAGNRKAYELVRERDPQLVMLLNNDTEVEPDTLRLMADRFDKDPSAGLVTPAITYAPDPGLIWHAGGSFVPWKMEARQIYRRVEELPDEPVEVDQVSGCAMMMRTELFAVIGYQDPALFIYHEDVEQSIRARRMGLTNWLVPRARVTHHVSVTVGGVLSSFAVYFTHRNRYIFAKRNLEPGNLALFTAYYLFVTLAKSLIYPFRGAGRLVPVMWLATLHGLACTLDRPPTRLF